MEKSKDPFRLGKATLVALGLALPGCGGGGAGGSSPGSGLVAAPAAVTGSVTRKDGSASNLAGTSVAATLPSGAVMATATTGADGSFSLSGVPAGSEIELEVADHDPAHAIVLPPLAPGEHVTVRCHVASGELESFALSGPNDDAAVRAHLSGANVSCSVSMERRKGLTHAKIDAQGAGAGASLHLVAGSTGAEIAKMTAGSDGSAHVEVEVETAGELEMRDDAGAVLAAGLVPKLPRDDAELSHRERGESSLSMASGNGSVSCDSDDEGGELEVEVEGMAPGQLLEVDLESQPGALAKVGQITVDARGRGRLSLAGSSLPAGLASLSGRRIEIRSGSTVVGSATLPVLSPDF